MCRGSLMTTYYIEVFVIKKVKNKILVNGDDFVGMARNKKEFRIEKVTTETAINYMFNGKDAIICLIAE